MRHTNTHQLLPGKRMRVFFLFACLIISVITSAQTTTIISPGGDGGFQTGGTFAANGWTVVNYTTGKHSNWYLNTGLTNGTWTFPSVNKCAFVSDSSASFWGYGKNNQAQASTVHFYRSVTFPATQTNMKLSFDLVSNGEGFNYDVLYVWLCPTTLTPVLGSPVSNSDVVAWAGSGTATMLYKKQGTSSPSTTGNMNVKVTIPPGLVGNCTTAKTMRLVFTWKNDKSLNYQVPPAIDNISLTSTVVSPAANLGTYTINNTLPTSGTNFNNFSDAISWINATSNCNAITTPVTFNVSAGQTFVENPPALTASGSATALIKFIKSGTGANPIISATGTGSFYDAGLAIAGGDYITIDGIDIQLNSGLSLEYGFLVKNASSSNGAKNITIRNASITLSKSNVRSIAVLQTSTTFMGGGFTPTGTNGMNSNNSYEALTIQSCYNGILLACNSDVYLDETNQVFNCIIGATYTGIPPGSLGGQGVSVYGIQGYNQKNIKVYNNTIRNLTAESTSGRGIFIYNAKGSCQVNNNNIYGLRNIGTTSESAIIGIDVALYEASGSHTIKVYNNMISDLTTAYSGSNQPDHGLKGIQTGGGTSTSSYYIDFNNVSINGSTSVHISSSAMEIGSISPKNFIRNNIFANYTGAQSGSAVHYAITSPSATTVGAAGSVCDNNDYYVPNTTNGYMGLGANSKYLALSNWKSGMSGMPGIDAASKNVDPLFVSAVNNLHVTNNTLNDAGNMSTITWVSTDFDNETRETTPDIGADEFYSTAVDLGVNSVIAPSTLTCFGSSEVVTVKIKNFGASTASLVLNPVTVSVTVTGPVSYSSSALINTGTLTTGSVLNVTMPLTINMSAAGTYTFTATTSAPGDIGAANNTSTTTRTNDAPATIPYSENFNVAAAAPAGYAGTGFSYGTHTGATESNQAFRNTWSGSTTGNFIVKKVGPITPGTTFSFDYRVLNHFAEGTAEEDPLWGNITTSISTDCGNTYTTLGTITTAVLPYTNVVYSLDAYAGSNVFIKIQSNWGGGAGADYWVDIDNINFSNSACTGTPVAGTASATGLTCVGSPVTISLTGYSVATGLGFQWYSSADNITFSPIAGAVTPVYNTTAAGTQYYYCTVNCSYSGLFANSNNVVITATSPGSGDIAATAINAGNLTTPYSIVGDNLTTNCWTNNYGDASPDIYYTFTPTCDGTVTASLCGSSFDTKLWLLDATQSLINSNDDFCGTSSSVTNIVTAGNAYFLVVEGNGTAEGSYTLNISEVASVFNWYADADLDGYGDIANTITTCTAAPVSGYVSNALDCDDGMASINPTMTEICNGFDDNCDGTADEGVVTATITPSGAVSVCKGTPVVLNASTGVGYDYQWFKNDNLIPGATNSSFITNKQAAYSVQISLPSGCFGVSAPTSVNVNAAPVATISAPDGTSLCTTVTLSASIGEGYTWQWSDGGGVIPGATSALYTPLIAGNYYCTITNALGCVKSTPSLAVTACKEGVNEEQNAVLNIYPNPTAGWVNIEWPAGAFSEDPVITIYNSEGAVISPAQQVAITGANLLSIDLSGHPNGLYFISIVQGEKMIQGKVSTMR